MCADNYRHALATVVDKFDNKKGDTVMSLFEQRLEVESDDGKIAACEALNDAGLAHLIPEMDKYIKAI